MYMNHQLLVNKLTR